MKYIPTENAFAARERDRKDSSQLVEYLTTNRKNQIQQFFNNHPKIFEMEQRFGKYLLVPLALPIFEVPDKEHFMHWWKKYAIRPVKQKGDYVASVTGYSPFESIDLVQKIGEDWNLNLQTENFIKEFPHLWQQFHDLLPCTDLWVINLWSSIQEFQEHRDSAAVVDCPNSFRIKLYDENPEETLFVFDNPTKPYHCEEPTFLPRLPDTNSYMWNNLRVMHGSVYDPQYKKVLAVIYGMIDIQRYSDLIEKSASQYSEHCLISKNTLENYVDI